MASLRSDAARNRKLVLQAAAQLRTDGESLQLNVVARRAGVGVGTVYRHFATPEQLTEALVHDRFAELEGAASAISNETSLRSFLERAMEVFVGDDDFAAVAAVEQPVLEATVEARRRLLDALAAGIGRAVQPTREELTLTPADVLVLLCGIGYSVRRDDRPGRVDLACTALPRAWHRE